MVSEGQILDGTYQLNRLVGEGGMGAVYEATHARLAGRYAIKVLLGDVSDNLEVRARFDREARITSLLQHPNVVQVIDHNTTADGTSYLVMEFLSGESLAERLARAGRLAVPAVVDIVEQIAAGLAAAHARGIVHRDLKPDNIFLVPVEGRATDLIKILDFGISKAIWSRDAISKEICGTPQYMAPEQAECRPQDVGAATDQYALAVIACELLTGKNPFAAESLAVVFERIRSGILPPTGLPGALASVLARALCRDGARRFDSVTAFADALRAALPAPPEPVPLPPPARDRLPPARARRTRRGGRDLRLGLAAAAAIAMTSLLGTGAVDRAPLPNPLPASRGEGSGNRGDGAEARALADAAEPVLTATVAPEASPSPDASEVRLPVRRARSARRAPDDRPLWTIPSGPDRREPSPALRPDEDATLPPSDL
jgi:serine/threonine protein kinase